MSQTEVSMKTVKGNQWTFMLISHSTFHRLLRFCIYFLLLLRFFIYSFWFNQITNRQKLYCKDSQTYLQERRQTEITTLWEGLMLVCSFIGIFIISINGVNWTPLTGRPFLRRRDHTRRHHNSLMLNCTRLLHVH